MHHYHKKRDLQVGKRDDCLMQRGRLTHANGEQDKDESKGGLTRENITVNVYICAYLSCICDLRITTICA